MKFKTGNIVNHIYDKSRVVKVLTYDDTKYFNGGSVGQNHSDDIDVFDDDDFELSPCEKFKIYLSENEKS